MHFRHTREQIAFAKICAPPKSYIIPVCVFSITPFVRVVMVIVEIAAAANAANAASRVSAERIGVGVQRGGRGKSGAAGIVYIG